MNRESRQPRSNSAKRMAAARTSAPSCVKISADSAANTSSALARVSGAETQSASAGQNSACAIHISVGKPNTSGHRIAVEKQA